MATTTASSGASNAMTAQQQDALACAAIKARAINMIQPIFNTTIAGPIVSGNNVVNIAPRNVGLLKRLIVEITATVTNTGSVTALTQTPFGAANLLSNVTLTDLSNNVRINTTGAHIHLVSTVKRNRPFGSAILQASTDSPVGFGSNFGIMTAPSSIAATANNVKTVKWTYAVPVTYSDDDLRGAIFLGVTGASMNLQLTLNPNFVVSSGDATLAGYSGNTGTLSNVQITVSQNYLDQLPMGKSGYVLPVVSMSTLYMLLATTQTGMVANQDFPVPYANFRSFLSTVALLDEAGTLNGGTDINYWALTAANYTNLWKVSPGLNALMTRNAIGYDMPVGAAYFNHRHKPIDTQQFGNMELILNANSNLSPTATLFVYYEMMTLINMIAQSSSLAV